MSGCCHCRPFTYTFFTYTFSSAVAFTGSVLSSDFTESSSSFFSFRRKDNPHFLSPHYCFGRFKFSACFNDDGFLVYVISVVCICISTALQLCFGRKSETTCFNDDDFRHFDKKHEKTLKAYALKVFFVR